MYAGDTGRSCILSEWKFAELKDEEIEREAKADED